MDGGKKTGFLRQSGAVQLSENRIANYQFEESVAGNKPLNGRMTQSLPILSTMHTHAAIGIATLAMSLAAFTLQPGSFITDRGSVAKNPLRNQYLAEFVGHNQSPVIVLFVVSLSCSHCFEQIEVFARAFESTAIVVVSPQMDTEIRNRLPHKGLRFLHDVNGVRARYFRVADGHHATFIFDARIGIVWQHVDAEPLLDTTIVRDRLRQFSGKAR